jgi:hypothetical protein
MIRALRVRLPDAVVADEPNRDRLGTLSHDNAAPVFSGRNALALLLDGGSRYETRPGSPRRGRRPDRAGEDEPTLKADDPHRPTRRASHVPLRIPSSPQAIAQATAY